MSNLRGTVVIGVESCKGCELCIEACPQESLGLSRAINSLGYRYAVLVQDNCTGCVNCALVCPDSAITVYRVSNKKGTSTRTASRTAATVPPAAAGVPSGRLDL